jgi:hypothetical protein
MTAEIAIMNKTAVALAADSAVTIEQDKGQKIFNTVNKLFTLSKYHPVGIMIYGSANFMDVPWESIIKIYRTKLGKKQFSALKEYADTFICFLSESITFFPENEQKKYFGRIIAGYKDELAAMAESLVNLTSFKRKISLDAETVGGPIDVAVISKGDGFVWIKRKHYFKPELNPGFFANYFRENKEEPINEKDQN